MKLFIITTSRSDWGALRYIIQECDNQKLDYQLLDYKSIQKMTFKKAKNFIIDQFEKDVKYFKIKNIFILGDRWETLFIASLARLNNLIIFHQGGGEISYGSYDDDCRRAISQLSDYHFVINDRCKERLMEQGIKDNIYICGTPRLDNKKRIKRLCFKKKTALVIYHPTTKNEKVIIEINEVLDALRYFDMNYIILYPNLDKNSNLIIHELKKFAFDDRVKLLKNLKLENYYEILNSIDLMIGNSSAGIIETASYCLPTVNVGDRQKGRDCNDNVIHCNCKTLDIVESIKRADSKDFKEHCKLIKNKFGDGQASKKIVEISRSVL